MRKVMAAQNSVQSTMKYLDFQAYVGITKHNGGFAATDELHALCHMAGARQVLEVGCGIGVGPAYMARQSLREMYRAPADAMEQMGYGLFAGKKQEAG
jgi:hypothetical protein